MRLEQRAVTQSVGTILWHNAFDAKGNRLLKKGTRIEHKHLDQLEQLASPFLDVMVLDKDDVHEDEAALTLAESVQDSNLYVTKPAGGRVNLRTNVNGLVEVDADRLLTINLIPGFSLATRRQHALVGPAHESDNVATFKIIPFAVPRRDLEQALIITKSGSSLISVRAFQKSRKVSMLLIGELAVHEKLHQQYVAPTRTRLEQLSAELVAVEMVDMEVSAIAAAASRLEQTSDLLITASQTSIIHNDDTILRALRKAGADLTLSGAPVEPGNLLALAYFPQTPVLCAPGCARGLKRNVVDIVLPRLLLGDRLDRQAIASLGAGGFLTKDERARLV